MNPLGGLARKAKWIEDHRKEWDAVVVADAGDLFYERNQLNVADRAMALDRAHVYLEAMAKMGTDVFNVGDRDLALGVDVLRKLAKQAKFPFVSSNIVDATTSKPVFEPRVVLDKAGVKIGVIGLVRKGFPGEDRIAKDNGIRILPPVEAARAQVEALRKKGVGVIIALAQLTQDEMADLAEKVPDIDVILGSDTQQLLQFPRQVGHTFLTDVLNKGKYLGVLTLLVHKGDRNPVFVDPNHKANLERRVRELEARLKARQQMLDRAKAAQKGQPSARNLQWLEQTLASIKAQLAEAKMDLQEVEQEPTEGRSLLLFEAVALGKNLADDEAVLAKTEALKEKHPELKKRGH